MRRIHFDMDDFASEELWNEFLGNLGVALPQQVTSLDVWCGTVENVDRDTTIE